jgi:hypothetical protein
MFSPNTLRQTRWEEMRKILSRLDVRGGFLMNRSISTIVRTLRYQPRRYTECESLYDGRQSILA